eukprot:scaffold93067_cov66-Phaeocystis_antarctica.AAC.3
MTADDTPHNPHAPVSVSHSSSAAASRRTCTGSAGARAAIAPYSPPSARSRPAHWRRPEAGTISASSSVCSRPSRSW